MNQTTASYLLAPEATIIESAPFDGISFDLCSRRKDVIMISADLSKYTQLDRVKNELPDQHLEVGMAEQNLLSVAAGVSKAGFVTVSSTFACYATRRAYDQMLICMGTSPLTNVVVGFTPGIANPARIHHQAAEDLGMIRAIPHATVIDPMDVTEFEQALNASVDIPGLVYLRGHRGNTPRLLDSATYQFEIGKTYALRHAGNSADSVGVISTGHATQWALEASDILQQRGVDHSVLHVPTIKPVNEKEIVEYCFAHDQIVTIENHQIVTGLGGLVAEIVSNVGRGPRITRLGLPNTWAPGGTLAYIREQLALDADQLASRIAGVSS